MYSFPRQLKGNCIHCNKEIYTFDNPDYNWLDHAAFVEKVDNNSCRIVGGYGSTTMDMSEAEFVDYSLYDKCMSKFREVDTSPELYICDDCIKELLEEGRIAFSNGGFVMSDYEVLKKVFEKSSWVRTDFHDKNIEYPLDEETFVEGKAIWVWDVVGDCVEVLFDKDGNII